MYVYAKELHLQILEGSGIGESLACVACACGFVACACPSFGSFFFADRIFLDQPKEAPNGVLDLLLLVHCMLVTKFGCPTRDFCKTLAEN